MASAKEENRAPSDPGSRPRFGLLLLPALALGWRLSTIPARGLWRDWVTILAAYGAFTLLASRSKSWASVTLATMAFLLGIYVQGQAGHTLRVLGLAP